MSFKKIIIFTFLSFSISGCAYLPHKTDSVSQSEQVNCQTRCSRFGMMVDPSNTGCGCVQFPGK